MRACLGRCQRSSARAELHHRFLPHCETAWFGQTVFAAALDSGPSASSAEICSHASMLNRKISKFQYEITGVVKWKSPVKIDLNLHTKLLDLSVQRRCAATKPSVCGSDAILTVFREMCDSGAV